MRAALTILILLAVLLPMRAAAEPEVLGKDDVLRGVFVQERVLQGFDAPLKSEGDFALSPVQGLIWRVTKPFAVTTLMTDQGLAQESDGTTTLNLPASRAPFMANLYGMLTGAMAGDWKALERQFSVERSEAGGKWQLRLLPKDGGAAGAPITEIRLTGSAFVETVEIEKPGGDLDRLIFSQQSRQPGPLTAEEQTLLKAVGKQ